MVTEVILPRQSEEHDESLITFWHVSEGDLVEKGDTLVEVQTEKAVTEIESPTNGKINEILKKRASTVKVGDVLAIIGTGTSKEQITLNADKEEITKVSNKKATPLVKKLAKDLGVDWTSVTPSNPNGTITANDIHAYIEQNQKENNPQDITSTKKIIIATPSVRKFARDNQVNLEDINTRNGQITKNDIMNYLTFKSPPPRLSNEPVENVRREPLTVTRKAIAKAMSYAHSTIPQVTHFDEVNATRLIESRQNVKNFFEGEKVKLTYLAYVIKAFTLTLKSFPLLNASYDESTDEVIFKKTFNIGIAVDTEGGLFVPVIQDVDKKSLLQVAQEIQLLSQKAKDGSVSAREMTGASSTISNLGSANGGFFTPIINAPQLCILGIGRIEKKPIVENDMISILPMMSLSFSYDHRLIDGVLAQNALNQLKKYLQNPDLMFAIL